jgi:hypothetical protein
MKTPISCRHSGRAERRVGAWLVTTSLALCVGCSGSRGATPVDGSADDDGGADDANAPKDDATSDAGVDREPGFDATTGEDTSKDVRSETRDAAIDVAARCPARVDMVEGCVLAADGELVKTPLFATMTVSAIEEIPSGACRISRFDQAESIPAPAVGPTRRLTLQGADGTQVKVVIRAPGLPDDLIQVGQGFDLSLQAWEDIAAFYSTFSQSILLTRGGEPVFVASTLNLYGVKRPDLSAAAIELADDGAQCGEVSSYCVPQDRRLRVLYGGQDVTLVPGDIARLGRLTFAVESYRAMVGSCDVKGSTQVAGFWSR